MATKKYTAKEQENLNYCDSQIRRYLQQKKIITELEKNEYYLLTIKHEDFTLKQLVQIKAFNGEHFRVVLIASNKKVYFKKLGGGFTKETLNYYNTSEVDGRTTAEHLRYQWVTKWEKMELPKDAPIFINYKYQSPMLKNIFKGE